MDPWTPKQDIFLTACVILGISLSWVRDNCVEANTDEQRPIIPLSRYEWARKVRKPNIVQALRARRNDGAPSRKLPMVPSDYDLNDVVTLVDSDTPPLPKFTKLHYQSQFPSGPVWKSPAKMPKSQNSPKRSPVKSVRKPAPKHKDSSVDEEISALTSGLTIDEEAKIPEVDVDNELFTKVIDLKDGVIYDQGIFAGRLNEVYTASDKKMWKDAYQVLVPLSGNQLNALMLNQIAGLVRTSEGEYGIHLKSPIDFNRSVLDCPTVGCVTDEMFGEHKNREGGLAAALEEKVYDGEAEHYSHTLLILPDHQIDPNPTDDSIQRTT
ncbi:hypothetical protein ACHAWF_013825 [Thalassiosira exigua]